MQLPTAFPLTRVSQIILPLPRTCGCRRAHSWQADAAACSTVIAIAFIGFCAVGALVCSAVVARDWYGNVRARRQLRASARR